METYGMLLSFQILPHCVWLIDEYVANDVGPSKALNTHFSKPQNLGYPVVFRSQNTFMMIWSRTFFSLESKQLL